MEEKLPRTTGRGQDEIEKWVQESRQPSAPAHSTTEASHYSNSIGIDPSDEERVYELARTKTGMSLASTAANVDSDHHENPFLGATNPQLDPSSDKFNLKAWLQALMRLPRAESGEVHRNLGLSFRDLSAYGYGSPTDYQKDFANVLLEASGLIRGLFGRGRKTKINILNDFDGVLNSGEMLVVLGRPGSGCTTLLKTLAGEIDGFVVDDKSVINYQGIPKEKIQTQFRGETIYTAETETHFPNLTVGQTLEFAASARLPRNRVEGVTREQHALHMRDVVMAIFGLSMTKDTKVGDDIIRGVSGGERKRVSIAEAFLSGTTIQCWDNSTRGLDSATALEFVKTLRISSNLTGATSIVAIYQASQAAYDEFDKVTVLYEGRQIYFGHTTDAKKYFMDMGFYCPERQTTADFLTSLTSETERLVQKGFESKIPRTPAEFAARWKASPEYERLVQEILTFEKKFELGGEELAAFKTFRQSQQAKSMRVQSPYTISLPMQISLCMRRGWQRLIGDMTFFFISIFGQFSISLIVGSVFYNLKPTTGSFYSRGACLFTAILMNSMSSALEILTLYAQRPIVEKHSRYAFYHPAAEAISSMICDLPCKILTAVSFNLALYFMTNLRREPGPFFIFFLIAFTMTMTMSMIFRTIASFSRTLSQAMIPSSLFILALTIYTGFVIPTGYMKPWFRWINYINPIGYAFEGMMINEFRNRQFPCTVYVPMGPSYANVTSLEHVCSTVGATLGSEFVEGNNYLAKSFHYYPDHLWRNYGILIGFLVFFLFLYLFGAEFVSAKRGKGEILVFKRGALKNANARGPHEDPESRPVGKDAKRNFVMDTDTTVAGDSESEAISLQKQTAVFHWKDVCYDIKIKGAPRRLLDHVDGWVKPGTLTALMGASGAGKTTLLDVLASRVTMGVVGGDMLVDGKLKDESFQRKTGYVQQQDLHLQTSTVKEALLFSALLRQHKDVSREEKVKYVDEVIRLLEMKEYENAVVGVPGEGLNVEQRKRLTIGVELAAKPQLLLFLDEPTSGLDSQTAWSICSLLRKLAMNGQAILCTIHQPSAILFQSFDRILLLASGGKTVFFGDIGPNSSTLTGYFAKRTGIPCPPDVNPAEWMLEQIGAAPGHHSEIDWPKAWKESEERVEIRRQLDRMTEELPAQSQLDDSPDSHASFAAGFFAQASVVTKRCFQQYWRTPTYLYSKVALCVLPSLFVGFSFYKADNTIQGLQDQMFAIFMITVVFGNLVQQIMPQFVTQRGLYEVRERPSKTYSWQTFIVANTFVEIPWQALMGVLMFFCWYYPIGLYRNGQPTDAVTERSGLMFLLILSFMLFTSTFTSMVIAGIELAETGGMIANLMFSLTIIFCGVLAGPKTLPRFWIFMYRVSPFTYLISAMLSVGLANVEAKCSSVEISTLQPAFNQTCGEYMAPYVAMAGGKVYNPTATANCEFCAMSDTNIFLAQVNSYYSERWRNFGFMWVYILFNIFAAVFIYWLVRVPKNRKKIRGSKEIENEPEPELVPVRTNRSVLSRVISRKN